VSEPVITTEADLRAALGRVSFLNTALDFRWEFHVRPIADFVGDRKGFLVWATFDRPDTVTGEVGRGRGRDEVVWAGTSLSGAVKTAWLLVELLVRHELMEGFRFDGQRIFNPHNSVFDLADLQRRHDAERGIVATEAE
jgi:hypothetical protein